MRHFRTRGMVLLALSALGSVPDALACGGTFCDSPPPGKPPMPVDQSGENVLFILSEGHVEAHIQIQYTGDPTRFAWLVPVPAVPELSVGSQQLFTNLLNATVPTFFVQNTSDICTGSGGRSTSSGGCGFGMGSADTAAFNGTGSVESNTDAGARNVVVGHEAVGAFDVTVLQPKSASEITTWLEDNGFLQAADAPPILQDYIDRGHVFAAVKLKPGAGVNEIHPLVVRYPGTEPCIPLKLTAIAATEDMGVRAFFLGDRRVVPTTYRNVTLNPARFDWTNQGSNYTSVVSRAVDDKGADGHAFVTEYAGVSTVVDQTGIYSARWSAEPFRTALPEHVMELLGSQGLVSCSTLGCVTKEPLILPIVRKYLPAPAGMSELDFYGCLACNRDKIDATAWDGAGFASDLDDRVIQPGKHAMEILTAAPYLTRLFTTISPDEMTNDPEFASASLSEPPVSAQLTATRNTTCGGDIALEGSGTPTVALQSGQMPRFPSDMPFTLAVDEYDAQGKRTPLYDNVKVVDTQIKAWNDSQGYPHAASSSTSGSSGGNGGGATCACSLGGGAVNPGGIVLGSFVLSLVRRFRRRSRRAGLRR
jgi:hypothetical protein